MSEYTESEVEAVAAVLYRRARSLRRPGWASRLGWRTLPWRDTSPVTRRRFEGVAREALDAARGR